MSLGGIRPRPSVSDRSAFLQLELSISPAGLLQLQLGVFPATRGIIPRHRSSALERSQIPSRKPGNAPRHHPCLRCRHHLYGCRRAHLQPIRRSPHHLSPLRRHMWRRVRCVGRRIVLLPRLRERLLDPDIARARRVLRARCVCRRIAEGRAGARLGAIRGARRSRHCRAPHQFDDGRLARVTFSIPTMHCASCVWLLEQLWRFDPGSMRAEVDLLRRTVHVEFRSARDVAARGSPSGSPRSATNRSIIAEARRIAQPPAVAGCTCRSASPASRSATSCCSASRGTRTAAPLDGGFQRLFDVLNVLLAVPVLLFSASDYFRTAWRAVRTRVDGARGARRARARRPFHPQRRRHRHRPRRRLHGLVRGARLLPAASAGCSSRRCSTASRSIGRSGRSCRYRSASSATARPTLGAARAPAARRLHRACGRRRSSRPTRRCSTTTAPWTTRSSPASRRRSRAMRGETVRAGGRVSADAMRLRVAREVSHSQLASLWNNPVFGTAEDRTGLTDVAARFGGWFTVGAIGAGGSRRDRLVAGRGCERQRRDGGAHHRVPVRADAVGADHARHRDGACWDARALSEASGRRARPQPHRHGRVRQDRHADHGRRTAGRRAHGLSDATRWRLVRRLAARIRPPDEPRDCRGHRVRRPAARPRPRDRRRRSRLSAAAGRRGISGIVGRSASALRSARRRSSRRRPAGTCSGRPT